MSYEKPFYNIPDKPLTSDEINEKINNMMERRARQDAQFRRTNGSASSAVFFPIRDKPLTNDEMNEKINNMMERRARQNVEVGQRFSSTANNRRS